MPPSSKIPSESNNDYEDVESCSSRAGEEEKDFFYQKGTLSSFETDCPFGPLFHNPCIDSASTLSDIEDLLLPDVTRLAQLRTIHSLNKRQFFEKLKGHAYSKGGVEEFNQALKYLRQSCQSTSEQYLQYFPEAALLRQCSQDDKETEMKNRLEARYLARHHFHLAATVGHSEATAFLGFCYELGIGVEANRRIAASLYAYSEMTAMKTTNDLSVTEPSLMGTVLLASLWFREPTKGSVMSYSTAERLWLRLPPARDCIDSLWTLYDLAQTIRLPEAQYMMGRLSEIGAGVPKDPKRAFEFYLQGALGGYALAACSLARCFEQAIGVDEANENIQEAKKWYRIAIKEAKDTEAMLRLGRLIQEKQRSMCCSEGEDSLEQAFELYKRAAELASPGGYFSMAQCYEHAIGTDHDPALAVEMYSIAAMHGMAEAQYAMGICWLEGIGLPKKSTFVAFRWFEQASEAGHLAATLITGKMLLSGIFSRQSSSRGGGGQALVQRDVKRGIQLIRKAALEDCAEALFELGICYLSGLGASMSLSAEHEAVQLLERACELGLTKANLALHELLFYGTTTIVPNPRRAMLLLAQAAELGDSEAQATLADYYVDPELCKGMIRRNLRSAHFYYRKAAEQGLAYAQYQLALQYFGIIKAHKRGDGGSKIEGGGNVGRRDGIDDDATLYFYDLKKAIYWMEKAAMQRVDAAEKALLVIKGHCKDQHGKRERCLGQVTTQEEG